MLTSAAAGALFLSAVSQVQACGSGVTVTCSGALTGPIEFGDLTETVNINAVTGDIVVYKNPDPVLRGKSVISLVNKDSTTNPISVTVDLTKANPADGFYTLAVDDTSADGDWMSGGIDAISEKGSAVTIISKANITAPFRSIYARSIGAGDVVVNSTGNVLGSGGGVSGPKSSSGAILGWSTTGAVTVSSKGTVTSNYIGLYAVSSGSKLVSVTNTGDITVFNRGIDARNYGTGNVEITSTGNITTTNTTPDAYLLPGLIGKFWRSHGIMAVSTSGTINITASGTIYSTVWDGIHAVNDSGAVTITNNANVTKASSGILVRTNATKQSVTGATTVTNNGTITNSASGINIVNKGSGAVTVTNNATISTTGSGIFAESLGGPVTVTVNTGAAITVSNTTNNTADAVSLKAAGDIGFKAYASISSANGSGITTVTSGASKTNVTVKANVTAAGNAFAVSGGSGDTTVTSEGTISGGGNGIYVGGGGKVSVTSVGNVSALLRGIGAASSGAGAVLISSTGNINTTGNYSLDLFPSHAIQAASVGGSITVSNNGDLETTRWDGINAKTSGGEVTVTSSGAIKASSGSAIYVVNSGGGVQVTNSGGVINASKYAIRAAGGGTGAVNVLNTGDIDSGGIYASGSGGKVYIKSVAAKITTAVAGIRAVTKAPSATGVGGDVEIVSSSNITAGSEAILAFGSLSTSKNGQAGKVTVNSSGNLTSTGSDGISVTGYQNGVSITNSGVIDAFRDGIEANVWDGGSTTINVSAGSVKAAKGSGIRVDSRGNGKTEITSAVDVTTTASNSSAYAGIFAGNSAAGSIVVVSNGAVTSTSRGIFAYSVGTAAGGSVSVTSKGVIQAASGGIVAYTKSISGTVVVETLAGSVTSGDSAIVASVSGAHTSGTGNVTVTNRVNLVMTTKNSSGGVIQVTSTNGTGEVKVDSVGNITGGTEITNNPHLTRGINISSSGTTTVTLTSDGAISSGGLGVSVSAGGSASATLHGSVSSINETAVYVFSEKGSVSLTGTASVASTKGYGVTVRAVGSNAASFDFTGNVTSGRSGVSVRSNGGNVTVTSGGVITASGSITSSYGIGIRARTATAGSVNVTSSKTIYATRWGIVTEAVNGTTNISVTGDIKGTSGPSSSANGGIWASASGSGGVNLTTGSDISVMDRAIRVYVLSGAANITTSGKVASVQDTSSGSDEAIYAWAENGGSITITASGDVSSADGNAIYARVRKGSGAASITTNANVTGTGHGLLGKVMDGDLTVTANKAVTATTASTSRGIYARSWGKGNISVTALGGINANQTGIWAYSYFGNLTVSTNGGFKGSSGGSTKVSRGIYAYAGYGGTVTVNVSGNLDTVQEAVFARGWSKTSTTVTVDMQGDAVSSDNSAIVVEGIKSNLNVKVAGLTMGASNFAGVEFGDGGATNVGGVNNTLQIMSTAHVKNASNTATVLNQLAIWGRQGNDAVTNFGTVTGSINLGSGSSDSFRNETGATFVTGNTVNLGSAGEIVTNKGNLNVGGSADNAFTTAVTGGFTQESDGVFLVDFKPDDLPGNRSSDLMTVTGNVSLAGTVKARQFSSTVVSSEQDFVILSTTGTLTVGTLNLQLDNSKLAPGVGASLVVVGQTLVLRFTLGAPIDGRNWDGENPDSARVDGGKGTWNTTNINWTGDDGLSNNDWPQDGTAVFGGFLGGGAVTVKETQSFGGLSFKKDNYELGGDGTLLMLPAVSSPGATTISVDTGMTANIATTITDGANNFSAVKNGEGTLILSGNNTFDGGVLLNEGTLGVGSNSALGTGALTMQNSTTLLAAAGNLTVGNVIDVNGAAFLNTQTLTMTLTGQLGDGAGTLNKTGTGSLILNNVTSLAGLDVQGGTLENRGSVAAGSSMAMSGANTTLLNTLGASVTVNSGAGSIQGAAGSQSIDNAGTINSAIALQNGNDSFILRASGTQTGAVDGGSGTGDFLRIETAAAATRTITQTSFTGFEQVQLNQELGSTGTLTLQAASNPATQATLDAGAGAGSSVILNQGAINLDASGSSIRADAVTIKNGAELFGEGTVYGLTTNEGRLSPGLSSAGAASIKTLTVDGGFAQTSSGVFYVNFNPTGAGSTDLLSVSGSATLDGAVYATQWSGTKVDKEQSFVILTAAGGINGSLQLASDNPAFSMAPGFTSSLRVVGNNVVLAFTSGRYWDGGDGGSANANAGVVDGGNGTWNLSNKNWTLVDGSINNDWPQGGTAIFAGQSGGNVLVVGEQEFGGLDFRTTGNGTGYVLKSSSGGNRLLIDPDTISPDRALITVASGQTAMIETVITDGANSYALEKTGAGTLNLMVANTFDGGVLLNEGTLGVGSNSALGTGALTMQNSTTLLAAAGNLTVGNTVTLNGTGGVNTQGFTLTLDGTVSGPSGILAKTGAGTLNLLSANSFGGGVLLNEGTLGVGSNSALGTGALTMQNSTTLLAAAGNLTVGNVIDVNGAAFLNTQTLTMTLTGQLGDGAGTLNKTGTGKLILDNTTSLAGLDVQGGTLENQGNLAASAMAMSGANTTLLNAAEASVTVNGGNGAIQGAAGSQSIDNAGIMNTSVNLGADGDSYILRASGSQTGAVAGGTGADFLQVETGSGAQRNIAAAAFTGFETIELNLESGSTGKFQLAAAIDPAVESTMDTGGGTGSSLTLNRGELNLLADDSSVRALNVNIANTALLSGIGQILNGPDGLTANAGTISPGNSSKLNGVSGSASIGEINLAGNLSQAATGAFYVDFKPDTLSENRANDALILTGNANLSGTVFAQQWAGTVVDSMQSFVILESTGGVVTNNGLALELVNSAIAPGFTYAMNVVDTNKLVLSFLMKEETREEIKRTDPPLAGVKGTANSVQSFTVDLIGCPQREGVYAYIEEDQCAWADIGSGLSGWNPSGKKGDVDQTTWWLAGGGQAAVTENIRLGMAGRYENISQNVGGNAQTDGVIGHWGAMAAYNAGPLLLASGLSVGRGWLDTRREISIGGFQAESEAEASVSYVSGKIRGGYLFDFDAWYLKPLVDLDASRLWYGGGTESMDNGMSMSIGSETENLFSVSPRMEVGGQWETEEGMIFRPMLQLGATIYSDAQFSLSSQFVDTPEDTEAVITKTELDQVTLDISAAVDVFNAEGNSLRVYYDGSFGETSYSHAGGLRLRIGF